MSSEFAVRLSTVSPSVPSALRLLAWQLTGTGAMLAGVWGCGAHLRQRAPEHPSSEPTPLAEESASEESVEGATVARREKCVVTDFSQEDILDNAKWNISTWGSANRKHSVENVWVEGGQLYLKVSGGTPRGETTTGAEISSVEEHYLYGSFRVVAQATAEPGTVFGFFYYLGDESEIDIEVLSIFDEERLVHFTIHENDAGEETHRQVAVGFRPSEAFHEYRFDWFEDRVDYYIDGRLLVTLSTNVPNEPGRIIINHWTGSSDLWGGGPPERDAIVRVRSIELCSKPLVRSP